MSKISNIPSITCKVECGTERGTAFFVDAHRLLTAYHVVGAALNGNPIYVEIEGLNYECELTKVKYGKDIAILRLKDETVDHEYGSLLSMPIAFSLLGLPQHIDWRGCWTISQNSY